MRIVHTRSRFVLSLSPRSPLLRRALLMRIGLAHRYIYDLYYKREAITRELYDWLLKEEYADAK